VIWILTTHPTDEWISIQKRHLSACLPQDEYRVIAVVPDGARGSFDIEISDTAKNVEPSPAHQKNLSALTRRLVEESPKPDDVLIHVNVEPVMIFLVRTPKIMKKLFTITNSVC